MAILILEHSDASGSGRLGATLRDSGHKLRVVRLHQGDVLPPDLDNVDAILTCGGPQSANDDSLPWLAQQMQMLRAAHDLEMPIVGVCLGSQILGRALGGTVERMANGIEFGWHEVKLTPIGREDIIHTGIAWTSMQFHSHREAVTQLPPGARLLARSAACPVQAWSMGLRTYGFQYHPEVTAETIMRWESDDPDALKEAGITREQLREQTQQHYPAFERLTARLFESIALFLSPVDRRYQGAIKDLHY